MPELEGALYRGPNVVFVLQQQQQQQQQIWERTLPRVRVSSGPHLAQKTTALGGTCVL